MKVLNIAGAFVFLFLFTQLAVAQESRNNTVYTVGIVPQFESKKIFTIWRPILDELEQRTGFKFTLRGAPTIPAFEVEFNDGNFDFAYMNPYHVLKANQSVGYIPLVRDVGRRLHGILVVRKDSAYQSPSDLEGKAVAFPAPNALGASLIMRADFKDIFHTEIKPRYVKTHSSVYLNVALGETEAGGGVQKTFAQQPDYVRDELKVIYRTRDTAPHPFAAHPRIPDDVREKVTQAFIDMGNEPKGKALFQHVPIKQMGQASMDDYWPLSDMHLERLYVEQ